MSVLIIAEAGVNHNGSLELAKQLIDEAAAAGADIVKFQTFKAAKLVTSATPMADYQKKNMNKADSQFEMLKKLELSDSDHFVLKEYCEKKGIEFLSTAFDEESLDFLVNQVGIKRVKIPSGEITNAPFLFHAASKKLPIILSTGMSTPEEMHLALDFIAYGLIEGKAPFLANVKGCRSSAEGKKALQGNITILHCTSDYPTAPADVNLNTILFLKDNFDCQVGFSDHSAGITAPIGAAVLGATIIEKHFTLDKNLPGPDHKASLDPRELKSMVDGIREAAVMLGSYNKSITAQESKTKTVARKFLVAKTTIKTGTSFTSENITCKRSGGGIEPHYYFDLLTHSASRDYSVDEPLIENING